MSTRGSRARVVRGHVVTWIDDPHLVGTARAMRSFRQGAVVIDAHGRIAWRGHHARLPHRFRDLPESDFGAALVLPGLIDAHIHFPQYRMLAAPGRDLLDWLSRFTFPEERRYRNSAHAAAAAEQFLDRLLAHGTTCALAFSTVHAGATDALFAAAARREMAMVTGKTMMDRNAPADLCDDPCKGADESAGLIARWHRTGRARYAITVRFAITSTDAQLAAAGALAARHPDCLVHSHLSESAGEVEAVRRLFPAARDYTDVYDRHGLLGPRSLFAHGIHLSERERERLHEAGATIVHCPTSNTFLGSGLLDIDELRDPRRPVGLGIATDVAGGTTYSMLATLAEAHKVAMLGRSRLPACEAFYLATLGNARHLGLDGEIGALEPGRFADIAIFDPRATPVLAARDELSRSLEDRLFALMILGDDRAVRATFVAGLEHRTTSHRDPSPAGTRST